ncbi:MAG: 2-phosphosulfolactate phosphatase [Rivularia sp. (in: Bacteria)]|nr:2-phosphosulfolactate phosphatase [Rivularia sp. MS3]
MIFNQSEFDLRCEWGQKGINRLASISDVAIVVDILSFSTAVEIATNNGAIIFPYRWKDGSAIDYAKSIEAELATKRTSTTGYSLSPQSLTKISTGTKLVLPSPNGSSLTLLTGNTLTIAGCLRNCEAVARFAQKHGDKIAVIPAGEKWEDNTLRPALEDLIGAGAILSYLSGSLSPEAKTAVTVFNAFKNDLLNTLKKCSSGKELIHRGFAWDIELAAEINVSDCVPIFTNNAYVRSN